MSANQCQFGYRVTAQFIEINDLLEGVSQQAENFTCLRFDPVFSQLKLKLTGFLKVSSIECIQARFAGTLPRWDPTVHKLLFMDKVTSSR